MICESVKRKSTPSCLTPALLYMICRSSFRSLIAVRRRDGDLDHRVKPQMWRREPRERLLARAADADEQAVADSL